MIGSRNDDQCSLFIKEIIEILMIELDSRGILKDLYEQLIQYRSDKNPSCDAPADEEQSEAEAMSLSQMSGIFYIHAFFSLFALIAFFVHRGGKRASRRISRKLS